MFRSETMELYSLVISKDNGWEVMNELGKTSTLHFLDLNQKDPMFSRIYSSSIKRCDEAERKARFIEEEAKRFVIPMSRPDNVVQFLDLIEEVQRNRLKVFPRVTLVQTASSLLDEYENELGEREKFIKEQSKKFQEMQEKRRWLIEYRLVLVKTHEVLHQKAGALNEPGAAVSAEPLLAAAGMKFAALAGVINTADCERFKRLIFRVSRGNALVILEDVHAIAAGELEADVNKSIYVVMYREGEALKTRLIKVCDSFSQDRFDMPENFEEKKLETLHKIEETNRLIGMTRGEIKRALQEIAREIPGSKISKLEFIKLYLCKEKALYTRMNMLKMENALFRGMCWCPAEEAEKVADQLQTLQKAKQGLVVKFLRVDGHLLTPPTYLKTNEFTWVFQEIVSTYGTPSYREVNPAFFTIVTFPFLFGVMFGDACHGLILTGLSLFLCGYKDSLVRSKSLLAPLVKARYLLLLMGIFSTFCGIIYNDFAGLNFNFFRTCYTARWSKDVTHVEVAKEPDCVYPVGFDPYWKYSAKQLQYENSFKMKLAVIFGVIQMALGVFMKLVNAVEFKKKLDIYYEFIPQILFLLALFGFMDYLIFAKWLTDYSSDTGSAPYVITVIINMFLRFGGGNERPIISGQQGISIALFFLLFLCVPWMLLPKPFLLRAEHTRQTIVQQAAPYLTDRYLSSQLSF